MSKPKRRKKPGLRLPKRLEIGRESYRFVVTSDLDDSKLGVCHLDDKVALISTKQTKNEMTATWFHEWLHGVEQEFNLELGHDKINKLEWALVQLLGQIEIHES